MVNVYQRFILKAANIVRPIYVAFADKPSTLNGQITLKKLFVAAKEALAPPTMLVHLTRRQDHRPGPKCLMSSGWRRPRAIFWILESSGVLQSQTSPC